MKSTKLNLLKSMIPKAVLLPLTKEASNAIVKGPCQNDIIPMMDFPFRIGRESRLGKNDTGIFLKLRLLNVSIPNNDLYLINDKKDLQISKEHFQIEKKENCYFLTDRGSTNGTTINGLTLGGDKKTFTKELKDGDIIKIGNDSSIFKYHFLILEDIKLQEDVKD